MPEGTSSTRISRVNLQRLRLSQFVSRTERLQRSDFVSLLPTAAAEAVLDRAHLRRFGEGAVVFRQGDAGTSLFFVLRGEVQLSTDGVQIATCHPGDVFGEPELLRPAPRSLTAHAVGDLEVAEVERGWLIELGEAVKPLGTRLAAIAEERHKARDELDAFLKRW